MADVLVDDRLLRAVLADAEPAALRRVRRDGEIFTTAHFYLRLCRAVASPTIQGVLTRELAALDDEQRDRFMEALVTLPDGVGMVPLRQLGWRMAELVRTYRLNLLALEVLAAAERLGAVVCLAAGNEGRALRAAMDGMRLRHRVLPV